MERYYRTRTTGKDRRRDYGSCVVVPLSTDDIAIAISYMFCMHRASSELEEKTGARLELPVTDRMDSKVANGVQHGCVRGPPLVLAHCSTQ